MIAISGRPPLRCCARELAPGPDFGGVVDRIERAPVIPYPDMMRAMRDCEIVIARLEPCNPFNEAKSTLKWFEAALVEVPCVATPTAPFRAANRDGETSIFAIGLLAGLMLDSKLPRHASAAAQRQVAASAAFARRCAPSARPSRRLPRLARRLAELLGLHTRRQGGASGVSPESSDCRAR